MNPLRPTLIAATTLALATLACAVPGVGQPTAVPFPTFPPAPTTVSVSTIAPPILIDPAEEQQLYIELYQRVNLAVVSIRVFHADGIDLGLGSGFVIDTDGHIVTNNHVVEGGTEFEIDFANGVKARATVLGTDPTADLAVLKLESAIEGLVAVPLGDSDAVRVGERVIAIGNPFGLSGTMTIGIVSGLYRVLETDVTAPGGGTFSAPDTIQTDAAINPGNSGGPLLNLNGEVIGVNQAIRSETGENTGIGFAIASNTVKRIVPALINDGKFVYPFLGVSGLDEMSLDQIESLGLPQTTGVYVRDVSPGGPADEAGVRGDRGLTGEDLGGGGDLIIAIDGRPVITFADVLSYLVNEASVGQTVTLTVLRDGVPQDIPVTLGARP